MDEYLKRNEEDRKKRKRFAQDAAFLEPFLVEPALLDSDLMERGYDSDASDLLKRLVDIFSKLEEYPGLIRPFELGDLVETKGSQIGNTNAHYDHIKGTANIAYGMAEALWDVADYDIAINLPDAVHGAGFCHDLSAIFARYGEGELNGKTVNFKQTDLQLSQYVVATVLGLPTLQEISLHCGYIELAEMIADGTEFPGSEIYDGWREALSDPENRFYIGEIKADLDEFVPQSGPVSLLEVITSADHSQWPESLFSLDTVRDKFEARRGDIKFRYYDKHIEAGNPPAALGIALVERGGFDRTKGYFERVLSQIKK